MNRVLTLLACFLFPLAVHGDFQASFTGSRIDGLTKQSTIFESYGWTGSSGSLIDVSGSNIVSYSENFDSWTKTRVTVDSDVQREPLNNEKLADVLKEDGTASSTHYLTSTGFDVIAGDTYTVSMYAKSLARSWARLLIIQTGTDAGVYFDVANGGVGVTTSVTLEERIAKKTAEWYLCTFSWVAFATETVYFNIYVSEADGVITFDGKSQDSLAVFGAQIQPNDRWRTGTGIYHKTTSVVKPSHDLGATNTPVPSKTALQGYWGNKLEANAYDAAGPDYHSKANHDSFKIWDGDFTLGMWTKVPATAALNILFLHGVVDAGGMHLYMTSVGLVQAAFHKTTGGGAHVDVSSASSGFDDGYWHYIVVRRSSDTAEVCVDLVCGTGVDVTGYGEDIASTFYWGGYTGTSLTGEVGYGRIDAEALSDEDLAADYEALLGMYSSASQYEAFSVSRASVAYKEFSSGGADAYSPKLSEVAANHPRVADGILVEAQGMNLESYSQQIDNVSGWTPVRTTVTANNILAPDGTLTAELVREDGTAAQTHSVDHASVTVSNGSVYTRSVFAKATANRNWIAIANSSNPAAYAYCDLDKGVVGTVSNGTGKIEAYPDGWFRCSLTFTAGDTGSQGILYIGEADNDNIFDGLTQDSLYVWQFQTELGLVPTSAIRTEASSATRLADNITIDPHEAGTPERLLATEYSSTTFANKFTAFFRAKCLFSGAATLDQSRSTVDISGNAGTAASNRNRVMITFGSDGRVYAHMRDDSTTDHYIRSSIDVVDYSEWHSYRVVFDLADLSRIDMWIDGSNTGMLYTGNTGTATWDTTNNLIRLGQGYDGVVNGNCKLKDVFINNAEITP